jgi:hypothetical protein
LSHDASGAPCGLHAQLRTACTGAPMSLTDRYAVIYDLDYSEEGTSLSKVRVLAVAKCCNELPDDVPVHALSFLDSDRQTSDELPSSDVTTRATFYCALTTVSMLAKSPCICARPLAHFTRQGLRAQAAHLCLVFQRRHPAEHT